MYMNRKGVYSVRTAKAAERCRRTAIGAEGPRKPRKPRKPQMRSLLLLVTYEYSFVEEDNDNIDRIYVNVR